MIGELNNVEIAAKLMAYCLTHLAITILNKKFYDNKDEFALITDKAKKFVKISFR